MATIQAIDGFQTIGYEGISIETFLRRVQEYGIEIIIDIRANPISRKPGFSKTALKKISK